MNFGTVLQKFPAALKTPEGKLMEYGTASISLEEQSVDFEGEFVPLCTMGTRLQIVRIHKDFETQRFSGEVYLSSQNMLRLVSVTDEILPGASIAYNYDVSIDAYAVAPVVREESSSRFFLRHRHTAHPPMLQEFPVKIDLLSLAGVRVVWDKTLPTNQLVTLRAEHPVRLVSLHAEIERPIFGPNGISSYACRILNLSGENYDVLSAFIGKISLRENKLFPPAVSPSEAARL